MKIKMGKKNIVVLGAGFGGLRAAILISRKLKKLGLLDRYEVVLIDRNEHQTYTPLLYEAATTSKSTADSTELHSVVAYGIAKLVKRLHLTFVQSEINGIDLPGRQVFLSGGRKMSAEYLVVALGSETSFFGIQGLKENSLPFKTFRDAIAVRDSILNFMESGKHKVRVAIGGGGSTGVELAGELKMWCGELSGEEHKKCKINVAIVEAAPAILPGFDPKIVDIVKKRLDSLNVERLEGETIQSVEKNRANLKSGKKINFDLLVWAGGVKASPVASGLPLKTEERGRIEVFEGMECLSKTPDLKIYPRIYAIGDNTCVYDPETRKPIPGVARAAIEEADVASHNLIEEIKAAEFKNYLPHTTYYLPKDYPYIIPVGGKFAVAKIGPFVISGFLGWVLKGLVELNYLISIMPLGRALTTWFKGLRIFIQNDRLG